MLSTNRLLLKRLKPSDAPDILAFYERNQLYLKPYETKKLPSFYTLSYHERSVQAEMVKEDQGKSLKFMIYTKQSPEDLMGMINVFQITKGAMQSCSIGYKIDAAMINQGYMTEALEAVTHYIFEAIGLHRIEAQVMPNNMPSIKVLEKLGFSNEGYSKQFLKINGNWEDHLRWVLINPDTASG